jgi:hypothetical protein
LEIRESGRRTRTKLVARDAQRSSQVSKDAGPIGKWSSQIRRLS